MMPKNVFICSFPRSGTHFLLNTIRVNFSPVYSRKQVVPHTVVDNMKSFLLQAHPLNGILKNHFQGYEFRGCEEIIKNKYHLFYIMREGRDTLTSFYEYCLARKRIKQQSMIKFMRHPLNDNPTIKYKGRDVLSMFILHRKSWFKYRELAHFISFEQLKNEFDATVLKLSHILELDCPKIPIIPGPEGAVFFRKGIIGDYKNYFTEEDNEYYLEMTKDLECLPIV